MMKYRTQFAYLSNYNSTIFLRIQMSALNRPCLYISRPIPHNASTRDYGTHQTTSVRSCLFYLVHYTSLGHWSAVPRHIAEKYLDEYLSKDKDNFDKLLAPYSVSSRR